MKKFAMVNKMGKHFFATYRANSLNRPKMTDSHNFPVGLHYRDFYTKNAELIAEHFKY